MTVSTGDNDPDANASQLVNGSGETLSVNNDNATDLTITGANNTVNIESDLGQLLVNGSKNLLNFSTNITIQTCIVSGSDNTAQTPESTILVCEVFGSGNIGFDVTSDL